MLPVSSAGRNSSEIKSHNMSAILLTLLHNEEISRVHLAQVLGVSTATITNLVSELVNHGFVAEGGTVRGDGPPNVGRPQRALNLVPDARFAIGVHIDVGAVHLVLANIIGENRYAHTFHHQIETPWNEVLDEIVTAVRLLIDRSGVPPEHVVGVGVAASGLVDFSTGVNIIAPNLHWHDVPIRAYLHERLGLPVVVDNNVRAMAFGEAMFGIARDVNALAFVYARVGVGAGLVVGGQLYRGARAGAGEIGHTTIAISQAGGEYEPHTLESLLSEPVILRSAAELASQRPDGILAGQVEAHGLTLDAVFRAARIGDRETQAMLHERATLFGIAVANLANVVNPELIVLGGIFCQEQGTMLPAVETALRERAFADLGQVPLRITAFGRDAGMIGAAALALDHFFYRPQNSQFAMETR